MFILQRRSSRLRVAVVVEPISAAEENLAGFCTCSVAVTTQHSRRRVLSFLPPFLFAGVLPARWANSGRGKQGFSGRRVRLSVAMQMGRFCDKSLRAKRHLAQEFYRGTSIIACSRAKHAVSEERAHKHFNVTEIRRAQAHTEGSRSDIEVVASSAASFAVSFCAVCCASA